MLLSASGAAPAPPLRALLTSRVLLRLESCAGAVRELASTVARHPLADAWSVRYALRQAVRLSRLDGRLVDEHRLAGYLAGLPVPFRQDEGAEVGALRYARRLLRALDAGWPPSPTTARKDADRAEAEARDDAPMIAWNIVDPEEAALEGQPRLFRIAHRLSIARATTSARPGEAHEILPGDLVQSGLSKRPLPLLATNLGAAASDPEEGFLAAFLSALEEDAEDGLRFLGTLSLSWEIWRERIGPRRSHSRLPHLVDLAAASPILAPVSAARYLACSVRAASMMLEELVEAGVLIELSGRRSWKAYGGVDYSDLKDDLVAGWRPFLMSRRSAAPPPMTTVTVYGAVAPKTGIEPGHGVGATIPIGKVRIVPARVDVGRLLADADRAIARAKRVLAERTGSTGRD